MRSDSHESIRQLEGAGPVEITTAAKVAITTNDLPLASAIVTIIDRRPLDSRPFGVAEFAGRIYGEEHKRIAAKLTGTQLPTRPRWPPTPSSSAVAPIR